MAGFLIPGIISSRRFNCYVVRDPRKTKQQWETLDHERMYGNLTLTLDPREGARIFAKGETWSYVTESRCYVRTRVSIEGYTCRVSGSQHDVFDHERWQFRFVPKFVKPSNVICWACPEDDEDLMSLPRIVLTVTPFRDVHTPILEDRLALRSDYPFQAHA